ncbi:MAG: alpha/beta hydrolase [Flavobacteriales bacterium]|nr:alpha/beta hydrolase [Flavobacteriales bacterium]
MKKRYLFLLVFIGIHIALAIWFFNSPMSVVTDEQTTNYFDQEGLKCTIGHDSIFGHPLRWVEVSTSDKDSLPIVIFTHGAPGAANNFFQFQTDTGLLKYARLISIDRLGYSPDDQGNAEVSIQKQSEAIAKVLAHYTYPYVVAVGHSYGGPITSSFVLNNPEKVKAAILLAPALNPDEEKDFFIVKFTEWKAVRWVVPAFFMVAASEKKAHEQQLREMLPKWSRVKTPFIHIHGTSDKIVPYENVNFSKRMIPDSLLTITTIDGGSHMTPWEDKDLVKEEILRWIQKPFDYSSNR